MITVDAECDCVIAGEDWIGVVQDCDLPVIDSEGDCVCAAAELQ